MEFFYTFIHSLIVKCKAGSCNLTPLGVDTKQLMNTPLPTLLVGDDGNVSKIPHPLFCLSVAKIVVNLQAKTSHRCITIIPTTIRLLNCIATIDIVKMHTALGEFELFVNGECYRVKFHHTTLYCTLSAVT